MARDLQIEAAFTSADDAMQGLWALHTYLKAATDTVVEQHIYEVLPKSAFQLTHEWLRLYDPKELTGAIREIGIDVLLSRASLVSLVAILEGALDTMNSRLDTLSKGQRAKRNSKALLDWAFDAVKNTQCGSKAMLNRLPYSCNDLDNARRLRNCVVHNNGKYDLRYFRDELKIGGLPVKRESDAPDENAVGQIIQITTRRYEYFSRSHIEFLHILHNTIQSRDFGHHEAYNYGVEGKRIEWHRVLTGGDDRKL